MLRKPNKSSVLSDGKYSFQISRNSLKYRELGCTLDLEIEAAPSMCTIYIDSATKWGGNNCKRKTVSHVDKKNIINNIREGMMFLDISCEFVED